MRMPLAGLVIGVTLAAGCSSPGMESLPRSSGATRPSVGTNPVDFTATVAFGGCSGSIIRLSTSAPTDPALMLTNGHCINGESGFLAAGEVVVDHPEERQVTLLDAAGTGELGTVATSKIGYATMTDTDLALYQLTTSYQDLEQTYRVRALELSAEHPTRGHSIAVISGFHRKAYSCGIDDFVPQVREHDWNWLDVIRYTPECHVIPGTSGSPIVDTASGKVVGVNNTVADHAVSQRGDAPERMDPCVLNNPCEVDQSGVISEHDGIGYGQQTYLIADCMGAGSQIDLSRPACRLPKPPT